MSKTVIEVKNLSKQYRLGQVGTSSIADDLTRFWYKARGKEDPFLTIGDENDRTKKGTSEYVWALKDINFSVKQGEVLGIIGKNGAGKSTLLKILSRTTSPTTGEYKIKGRVASLLEVGTGFHPDLSGRENVFLNGAILGMTKAEIKKNFDEIVAFSGVERYIDTPVKRYSSGMYVRLAFAVAAHLDPEILIVDEVLAVGDAEFQKKCMGKIKDVSGQGRTILFVSHGLSVVKNLCTKTIYLKNGIVQSYGDTTTILNEYLKEDNIVTDNSLIPDNASSYCSGDAKFLTFDILNLQGEKIENLNYEQPFKIRLTLKLNRRVEKGIIDISIGTLDTRFSYTSSFDFNKGTLDIEKGLYEIYVDMQPNLLPGSYTLYFNIHDMANTGLTLDMIEKIGNFNVLPTKEKSEDKFPLGVSLGNLRVDGNWKIKKI